MEVALITVWMQANSPFQSSNKRVFAQEPIQNNPFLAQSHLNDIVAKIASWKQESPECCVRYESQEQSLNPLLRKLETEYRKQNLVLKLTREPHALHVHGNSGSIVYKHTVHVMVKIPIASTLPNLGVQDHAYPPIAMTAPQYKDTTEITALKIQILVGLGASEEKAKQLLTISKGDVQQATTYLHALEQ
ncbi:hypothetical protein HDV03_005426 [Kappamyces sp. JEL0829]|nr:hypothetical protein HDV03_005426 [Kappamyces sp. JEL0829]